MAAAQNGKASMASSHAPSASRFFERKNPGVHGMRRSTPDSEALASSDDDHDHALSQSTHSIQSARSSAKPLPERRDSWLSEVGPRRKFSVGSASSLPQQGSQPTTPATESGPFSWSKTTPTSSTRQMPPSATNPWGYTDTALVSPTAVEYMNQDDIDGPFPFPIPTEPVRKTVRSDSYSPGLAFRYDDTSAGAARTHGRPAGTSAHRPHRPSMLGDASAGRPSLGLVLEDDDDDLDGPLTANQTVPLPRTTPTKTDQLTTTTPTLLRQATVENARTKQRTPQALGLSAAVDTRNSPDLHKFGSDETDIAASEMHQANSAWNQQGLYRSQTFESASEEMEGAELTRRHLSAVVEESITDDFQDDGLENAIPTTTAPNRVPVWQSSLGFGQIPQPPESRRASFADPRSGAPRTGRAVRERTMSSSLLPARSQDGLRSSVPGPYDPTVIDGRKSKSFNQRHKKSQKFPLNMSRRRAQDRRLHTEHLNDREYAADYFAGSVVAQRAHQHAMEQHVGMGAHFRPAVQDAGPPSSMNPFAVPSVITNPQPDLYLVAFKCARAEIYYIPANTGLEVKVGDMVIVEGDRGNDLGTITHARVSMSEARTLKEQATDQHFSWLMMFSRTMQSATGTTASTGLLANSNGERASAVGGMGPRIPASMGGHSSHADNDVRPKMIRRLALSTDIHLLRDKEGAEAKAKRVCQGKVTDHGLNMEILDAEFQFDWRKLTFFYYADQYVNFNELVTDLFKVYKTRIWLSAINPASIASPTSYLSQSGPVIASGAGQTYSPVDQSENTHHSDYDTIPPRRPGRPGREPVRQNDAPSGYPSYPPVYGPGQTATTSPLQYASPWGAPSSGVASANVSYPTSTMSYPGFPPAPVPANPQNAYYNYRAGPAVGAGGFTRPQDSSVMAEEFAHQFGNMSLNPR